MIVSVRFVLFFSLISIHFVQAQSDRAIVNQPIEWFATTSNVKMTNKFAILIDGQYRFVKNMQPMQFQIRLGGDFIINDKLSLMPVGYVFVWNPQYGDQPATYVNNEHRIFQQAQFKHKLSRFYFQERLRTEERFLERHVADAGGNITNEGYSNFQFRIRYRFLCNIPLNHAKVEAKTIYIHVYDEVFMSWGKSVTYHEPDQNRIFTGLGYQFNPSFSMQGGFIYQMLVKANGAQQENNVGTALFLVYNFDLTK